MKNNVIGNQICYISLYLGYVVELIDYFYIISLIKSTIIFYIYKYKIIIHLIENIRIYRYNIESSYSYTYIHVRHRDVIKRKL